MSDYVQCTQCGTKQTTGLKLKPGDSQVFRGKCIKCNNILRFRVNGPKSNGIHLESDVIKFSVNGRTQTISNEYPLNMTLNEFIRDELNLCGTKVMCREGGCGSCVINGQVFDLVTQEYRNIALNSCLFPLYAANGWDFTTTEGIGSKSKGFHEIQKRLADNNGSQCGYCSPGMVMNMFSLLVENKQPSEQQIESSFDGNLCRCTGYRSILDAMKSFSSNPIDIEDLTVIKCLSKVDCKSKRKIHIINNAGEWFQPQTLDDLKSLLKEYQNVPYRFVSGDTAKGIYKQDGPWNVYINLQSIPELHQVFYDESNQTLKIGSSITLEQLIVIFQSMSQSMQAQFGYLQTLALHLSKVASVPVRNTGTWSGNLSIKHLHQEFPSDVFVLFETTGALLIVNNCIDNSTQLLLPSDYLNTQMNAKYIAAVILPSLSSDEYILKTFKIMPRSQNAHAYVNAGFLFKLNKETYEIVEKPTIVYGGISPSFIHATQTEEYLSGKCLKNALTLSQAFKVLQVEVNPNDDPVLASPDYRKSLATNLLYKYFCFVCKPLIDSRLKSACNSIIDDRQVSNGNHSFPSDPNMFPVTKPMTKLNAYAQASGEASYVYDLPPLPYQLEGAFITTKVATGQIDTIDYTNALAMPGVERIIFARDIPGVNNFNPAPAQAESLFIESDISYAGQAVGLVVAKTCAQACEAAKKVIVTYKNMTKPILTISDAIQANSFHPKPFDDFIYGDAESAIAKAPFKLNGLCSLDGQYHFYMEGQVAICQPTEDGYEIHSSTQWLDYVQKSVSQVMGVQNSAVSVKVKQLGGSYGGKITRANVTAAAAAVATSCVDKPVRVALDLNTCMDLLGKRFGWYAEYEIGCDENGLLLGIVVKYYSDAGCSPNDSSMAAVIDFGDNSYKCPNWHMIPFLLKTNKPANTACRSPGTFPAIAIMEYMIEHVAKYLNLDVIQVRQANLYKRGDVTPSGQPLPYFNVNSIINNLLDSSQYSQRVMDIQTFNESNRWKKRGISLQPLKWGADWAGAVYNTFVTIYNGDGSVCICHGGVETGQGIHTKAAQVCAYELGIPLELIKVRPANNLVNANSSPTGGSTTSELICQSIIECCKILNANLDPVRKTMPASYTWNDLIQKAYSMSVDLSVRYWLNPSQSTPLAYNVYGAAVSEALIDVLTGEVQILRTDILYDCGNTINGEIDIGQAEGGFIMGLGFWLTEKLKYDPQNGRLLTNGTWEYKPPTTKDVPVDFRITFLNNNPNPLGVLGSKCVGEPPLCLSTSLIFAVKHAIEAALKEKNNSRYFVLNSPATVDSIQEACDVDLDDLHF